MQRHNVWQRVRTILKPIFLLSLQIEQVRGIAHEHRMFEHVTCISAVCRRDPNSYSIHAVVDILCQIVAVSKEGLTRKIELLHIQFHWRMINTLVLNDAVVAHVGQVKRLAHFPILEQSGIARTGLLRNLIFHREELDFVLTRYIVRMNGDVVAGHLPTGHILLLTSLMVDGTMSQ